MVLLMGLLLALWLQHCKTKGLGAIGYLDRPFKHGRVIILILITTLLYDSIQRTMDRGDHRREYRLHWSRKERSSPSDFGVRIRSCGGNSPLLYGQRLCLCDPQVKSSANNDRRPSTGNR